MKNIKTILKSPSRKAVIVLDFLCITLCFALYTAIDKNIGFPADLVIIVAHILLTIILMVFLGAYRTIDVELIPFARCILAVTGSFVITLTAISIARGFSFSMWVSFLVPTLFSIMAMYLIRAVYLYYIREYKRKIEKSVKKPSMIIGAGAAAAILIKELSGSGALYYPDCLIDDDEHKAGTMLYGVPVIGTINDVPYLAKSRNIDTIIIAIPSASSERISEIANICMQTKCFLKILPSISEIIEHNGNFLKSMKDINMEDLLGREPIKVDNSLVAEMVKGKVCLVTGGGGSIGSELCRQIMKFEPLKLVIVDIYENNAYDIQQELKLKYGMNIPLYVEIASVRDFEKMDIIFSKYTPELVFHAAAHKHVPLMEYSAEEAVKNNVAGTYNVAELAIKHGATRFLLISTDKAVNPTNVMGASKRCCEKVIKYFSEKSDSTIFVTVRFGNVLGSNGSVVPLFEKQIARGGPITITHPDITRYFMTIPEAVSLVLQAETMAQSGQIFVLNMGKPVKIVTLAENLIKIRGYVPYKDIKIEFIGLREGEKLYEELRLDEEEIVPTYNEKIFIGSHIDIPDDFKDQLDLLFRLAKDNKSEAVIEQLRVLCPTFVPDKRVHKHLDLNTVQ